MKWISCNRKLPSENERLLVRNKEEWEVVYFRKNNSEDKNKWRWEDTNYCQYYFDAFTHWMKPEVPDEKIM